MNPDTFRRLTMSRRRHDDLLSMSLTSVQWRRLSKECD